MKSFLVGALTALSLMAVSAVAAADDHPVRLGVGADLGVPGGAGIQLTLHPKTDAVRLGVAADYNYLTFGGRASVELDPLALLHWQAIGLYADVQGGFFNNASVPGHSDLPQFGYDYLNLYGVLRLGNARGFHWNFMAGPTYMHITTGNFQSVLNNTGASGLHIGNPTVNGWLVPTFSTGFEVPITL